jgi:hypothetical protein
MKDHDAIFNQAWPALLLFAFFSVGTLCGLLLPRCADPAKVRSASDDRLKRIIGNPWLPRSVLTPLGVKLWWTRVALYSLAALILGVGIFQHYVLETR